MRKSLPISLLGLVATGVVFMLQLNPLSGFLMVLLAAIFWPIVLINASMVGVALEAIVGRVSRLWLLLPMMFYGSYWFAASLDHLALREMTSQYEVSNARVVTGFDPARHALVFEYDGDGGLLTQDFALPVAYYVEPKLLEGYRSLRIIESTVCAKLGGNNAFRAAGIVSRRVV